MIQAAVQKLTKTIPYHRQLFCEGEVTSDMFRWEIAFDNSIGLPTIEWVWATSPIKAVNEFLELHKNCHFFTVRLTSDNE